jgi:hypothetical protein
MKNFIYSNKEMSQTNSQKLNTLTTLISAGYPFWYAFGVSRGVVEISNGLRQDIRSASLATSYGEGDDSESSEDDESNGEDDESNSEDDSEF